MEQMVELNGLFMGYFLSLSPNRTVSIWGEGRGDKERASFALDFGHSLPDTGP